MALIDLRGSKTRVLCNATVDLIARHCRPYIFEVTVTGLPPHATTRKYTIAAKSDNDAAMRGIGRFVQEMERMPLEIRAFEYLGAK